MSVLNTAAAKAAATKARLADTGRSATQAARNRTRGGLDSTIAALPIRAQMRLGRLSSTIGNGFSHIAYGLETAAKMTDALGDRIKSVDHRCRQAMANKAAATGMPYTKSTAFGAKTLAEPGTSYGRPPMMERPSSS